MFRVVADGLCFWVGLLVLTCVGLVQFLARLVWIACLWELVCGIVWVGTVLGDFGFSGWWTCGFWCWFGFCEFWFLVGMYVCLFPVILILGWFGLC